MKRNSRTVFLGCALSTWPIWAVRLGGRLVPPRAHPHLSLSKDVAHLRQILGRLRSLRTGWQFTCFMYYQPFPQGGMNSIKMHLNFNPATGKQEGRLN